MITGVAKRNASRPPRGRVNHSRQKDKVNREISVQRASDVDALELFVVASSSVILVGRALSFRHRARR